MRIGHSARVPGDSLEEFRNRVLEYFSAFPNLFLGDVEIFVSSASAVQLKAIEKMIARRKTELDRPSNRRGRPREEYDPKWIATACRVSLSKHVEGLSWRKIAKGEGMVPGKPSQRTLSRKRDDFAELVFRWLNGLGVTEKNLDQSLDAPKIRTSLQWKFGIPFDSKKAEAARLVRELFPIGSQRKRSIREIKALLK